MSVCFLRISLFPRSLRFFLFLFFLFQLLLADPGMKRQHILFRFVPQPDAGLLIMQAAMGAASDARRQPDAFVAFLVLQGQCGVQARFTASSCTSALILPGRWVSKQYCRLRNTQVSSSMAGQRPANGSCLIEHTVYQA